MEDTFFFKEKTGADSVLLSFFGVAVEASIGAGSASLSAGIGIIVVDTPFCSNFTSPSGPEVGNTKVVSSVGATVGHIVGSDDGCGLGVTVGLGVGAFVGVAVGDGIGIFVGEDVGLNVGAAVGVAVGDGIGTLVAVAVAVAVGTGVGTLVGAGVGVSARPSICIISSDELAILHFVQLSEPLSLEVTI